VSASGARAGSPAVTTKGVEGAHEPRTKADNPTSRIANRLRQQSIISLLKRLARTLQIGDLRIGLGQRSLSRSLPTCGFRRHRKADVRAPGGEALRPGARQFMGHPCAAAKKGEE